MLILVAVLVALLGLIVHPPATLPPSPHPAAGDIAASRRLPDGRIERHIWMVAPGHTAQAVISWARARGFDDARLLTSPVTLAAHPTTAQVLPCEYGHARTLACPTVRWRASGRHNPFVWFEDALDNHQWGVPLQQSAVPNWHFAQVVIDIGYVFRDCSTRHQPGHKCVLFSDNNYGQTPWVADIKWFRDSTTHPGGDPDFFSEEFGGLVTDTDVVFNDYHLTNPGYMDPNRVVVRAAGLTLGLGSSTTQSSVMWPNVTPGVGLTWPTTDERTLLNQLYILGDI